MEWNGSPRRRTEDRKRNRAGGEGRRGVHRPSPHPLGVCGVRIARVQAMHTFVDPYAFLRAQCKVRCSGTVQ
jgi:hypothetical protein